jgi:ABC-type glycerol-3-phosphate transport system substrate-binding protein
VTSVRCRCAMSRALSDADEGSCGCTACASHRISRLCRSKPTSHFGGAGWDRSPRGQRARMGGRPAEPQCAGSWPPADGECAVRFAARQGVGGCVMAVVGTDRNACGEVPGRKVGRSHARCSAPAMSRDGQSGLVVPGGRLNRDVSQKDPTVVPAPCRITAQTTDRGGLGRRNRVGRRVVLASAAGAMATLLAGCSAPLRRLAIGGPTVIVRSQYLFELKASLEEAWSRSGSRGHLVIERPGNASDMTNYEHTGDIVDIAPGEIYNNAAQNVLDLRPVLSEVNFPIGSLLPSAVDDYRQGSALRGLPLIVGEWQFYVNEPVVAALGIRASGRWTWSEMVDALAVAKTKKSGLSSGLIGGTGWGDVNLWGAFVQGLGGSLTSGGHLALSGAVAPTEKVVAVARSCGWQPNPWSNLQNRQWRDFYSGGFSNSATSAIFAFLQPARIYTSEVPTALRTLPTSPFPLMGSRDVVPAYSGSGLAISPFVAQPERVAEALIWFYAPEQQQLLADNGWPPVVTDIAMRVWPNLQDRFPSDWPKFDAGGYTDIVAQITGGRPVNSFDVEEAVANACQTMYQGGDIESTLLALESQLETIIAAG